MALGLASIMKVNHKTEVICHLFTDNIFALQKWISKKFPEARDKLQELYKEVRIDYHNL